MIDDLPTAVLAVMKSVCLQGLPCPAMFSADTLKVYSRPSLRPVQVHCVALTMASLALTHSRLFLSFLSMQYPEMGLPPSLLGRSHDRITKSLLILLISKFLGSLGGSGPKHQNISPEHSCHVFFHVDLLRMKHVCPSYCYKRPKLKSFDYDSPNGYLATILSE